MDYQIRTRATPDYIVVSVFWKLEGSNNYLPDPGFPSPWSIYLYERPWYIFTSMEKRIDNAQKKLTKKAEKRIEKANRLSLSSFDPW